jgi:hypothetical protein
LANGTFTYSPTGPGTQAIHFFSTGTPVVTVETINIALGSGDDVVTINDTTNTLGSAVINLRRGPAPIRWTSRA